MRRLLLALLALAALVVAALGASVAAATPIRLSDPEDAALLAAIVDGTWAGRWQEHHYEGETYDVVRLAQLAEGYLPMIEGEGGQDVAPEVIEEVIFRGFDALPSVSPWVKHVEHLGAGFDPAVGAPYQDSVFHLDSVFMIVSFTWRIYQGADAQGRRLLWFERLDLSTLDPALQRRYEGRIRTIRDGLGARLLGRSVVEPAEVHGVFSIEPGRVHRTRVRFAARLVFSSDDSWLASYATRLPFVLRMAITEVFDAAVQLCVAKG